MQLSKFASTKEHKELMNLGTDCFPIRIQRILLIKQPWYFGFFWAIVKPFLKKKLVNRLQLFGNDVEKLQSHIDPSNIPVEFGGTLDYPFDGFLKEMEKLEARGRIGGFGVPLMVDDPTGEKRRAAGVLPPT
jgi:hypothetical protein